MTAMILAGCKGADSTSTTPTTTATGSTNPSCLQAPEETQGPFPGDGSNGANVLNQTGVVRSDIRSSFAALSGTAAGVPMNLVLTLVSVSTCVPLANRAVYVWHCERSRLRRFKESSQHVMQNVLGAGC